MLGFVDDRRSWDEAIDEFSDVDASFLEESFEDVLLGGFVWWGLGPVVLVVDGFAHFIVVCASLGLYTAVVGNVCGFFRISISGLHFF